MQWIHDLSGLVPASVWLVMVVVLFFVFAGLCKIGGFLLTLLVASEVHFRVMLPFGPRAMKMSGLCMHL